VGLLKKLKKLTLKKAVKAVAKVAPIAAAVIPGVGPVVAGAIALAGKVAKAAEGVQAKSEQIQDIIGAGDVLIGGPAPSTGPPVGSTSILGGGGLLTWIMIIATIFFLPKLFGRR